MLVVDCSVAAAAILDELQSEDLPARVVATIAMGDDATAPALFVFELRNAILMAERRGRITAERADRAMRVVAGLRIVPEEISGIDFERALTLARRHGLTVYDAAYIELALRRSARLASLDKAMVRAARSEGVAIFA